MGNIIFKSFQFLFRFVAVMLVAGTFVSTLTDIQKKAFHNKKIGLVSMLKINQQLVGKTK